MKIFAHLFMMMGSSEHLEKKNSRWSTPYL